MFYGVQETGVSEATERALLFSLSVVLYVGEDVPWWRCHSEKQNDTTRDFFRQGDMDSRGSWNDRRLLRSNGLQRWDGALSDAG